MKKQLLSIAILAAIAADASAAFTGIGTATAPVVDPSTTTPLFIGGASAERAYISTLITANTGLATNLQVCDQTQPIYYWADNSTSSPGSIGKNYDVWYCTKQSANTNLSSAATHLLIHKRSAGGSDYGVAPIINPALQIGFLNIANSNCGNNGTTALAGGGTLYNYLCTAPSGPIPTLTNATASTVDLGVSDVDPGKFVGLNVTSGFNAVTQAGLASMTIQSTATVVFGEQVTSKLFWALQAAQIATGQLPSSCVVGTSVSEACTPSLSSALIAGLHSGAIFDWGLVLVGNLGTDLATWTAANYSQYSPATTNPHIVRRAAGSGSQAQHGIHFFNYPCDLGAYSTASAPADDNGQTESGAGYIIHDESSAGNINTALKALDLGNSDPTLATSANAANAFSTGSTGGARWAVGLNSLEQTTSSSSNYQFVKIDGVAPTLANVVTGKYHDWVENTFQYNTNHAPNTNAGVVALRNEIISKANHPVVLAALNPTLTHSFDASSSVAGAYLAHPSLYPATVQSNQATLFDPTNPVNQFTYAPSGVTGDNCRVPTVWNPGGGTVYPYISL